MFKADVLSIGAHAGDAEIASGIALANAVNSGKKVAICHLTLGEKGHPNMSPQKYAELKHEEAAAAAETLGAQLYILGYLDGELPENDDVKKAIADVIRDCKPDVIITHHAKSIHKDHAICHRNVLDAIFYAALKSFVTDREPHFARHLYFAENWEDKEGFIPEIILEVTNADIELWKRTAQCYSLFRGEVVNFPYIEYYEKLARLRGIENYVPYAVTFAVPPAARKRRVTSLL
ncbi:MAG: PIG-L family deacetylase [Armatimonadota bacterium]|nr:PIG-L family deacetylase [Armatimonadota bacterium]